VLTALPYYSQTALVAHAGKPEGCRNELPYNENTYLLSLQTMLQLLHRPPAGFQAFIRDHFRRRGRNVLRACEAYLDGCIVGSLDDEARPTGLSKEQPSSAGFMLALANVDPRSAPLTAHASTVLRCGH
jgi:ubiquitin-conjugating enzyme E2 O